MVSNFYFFSENPKSFYAYSTTNTSNTEDDFDATDDSRSASFDDVTVSLPVANAGSDQSIKSNDFVQLDGSKSSDPNNSPLTYSWTQTDGPDVTLDNPSSERPTFTAPETTEDENIIFQLIVSNGDDVTSDPDYATVAISIHLTSLPPLQATTCNFDSFENIDKGSLTFVSFHNDTQIFKITPNPYTQDESLYFSNNNYLDCDFDDSIIVLAELPYSWYNVEIYDKITNSSKNFDFSITNELPYPIIYLQNKTWIPNLSYEPISFQYIVWLNDSISTDSLGVSDDYSRNGIIKFIYDNPPGFVINLNNTDIENESNVLENLNNDPRVFSIVQDLNGKISSFKYNNQTISNSLERINANIINLTHSYLNGESYPLSSASKNSLNFSNVDIAILDTRISLNHPDLNVYKNISFIDEVLNGDDDLGHGSHIAGIAAAKDNSLGIIGAAPGAKLWAIKVCDINGNCPLSAQIKGVQYVTEHADEIDVVNISIENPLSEKLDKTINASISKGLIYVVAAGNSHINSSLTSPARNPSVISVSAISDSDGKCGNKGNITIGGPDDYIASFSNFGNNIDYAAPGVDVLSTSKGNGYAIDSETSMAAPLVAGQIALYKSIKPNASYDEVISTLQNSSITFSTLCNGGSFGPFLDNENLHSEPLLYSLKIPDEDLPKTKIED
ncbi:MAG: S8 family serine peptidase [Nitrosopumilus sp.]|nr:S8 family serine peptidase [Nitrosopumilus sp.]